MRKILLDGAQALPARWATASSQSSKQGQAQRVELYFQEPDGLPSNASAQEGLLSRVQAEGQVRVFLNPATARAKLPLLPEKPEEPRLAEGSRILLAQQAVMDLAPDGETLREVRTQSSSTPNM